MKKLLILLLSIIVFTGYSQVAIPTGASTSLQNVNTAIRGSITAGGTDTYTATYTGVSNVTGQAYNVTFTNDNTTACTFNLNGSGAVEIRKFESGSLVPLVDGDISDGETKRLRYNGTYLVIEGGAGSSAVATFQTLVDGAGPFTGNGQSYVRVAAGETTLQYRTPTQVVSDLPNAAADGTTEGVSSYTANDFNASSGLISIDYTNGQAASGSVPGFLSAANWATFNGKQSAITFGTGVQTALGVNIGSAGAPVLFNGAGGTPSSITLSNGTGLPISTGVSGLGTGVATWLATPSYTNLTSALTGTAPWWATSGNFSLAGNTALIGTGNTLKYQFLSLGTTQTDGYGLWLQNTTVASSGNQQISPSIVWEGQGWKSQATAASQAVSFIADVLPVQGVGAPTAQWRLTPKINGSATSARVIFNSDGARVDIETAGLQIQTNAGGVGGISLNGSDPVSNNIIMTPGSFQITTAGAWSSAGSGITLNPGASINATSGTQTGVTFTGSFIPTSGTANFNTWGFTSSINQTGGASGQVSALSIKPTYTLAPNVIAIDYDPTVTSASSHVFLRNTSGNILFGGSTITASTRVDQRGLGSTSSTINHRWANSSNTVLAQITDDGALALKSTIVGRAVLVAGTVTVNTGVVQSTDEIFLTNRITGGTVGFLSVGTVTNGTSFVINSSSALDTSTISWMIIKTAP